MINNEKQLILQKIRGKKYQIRTNLDTNSKLTLSTVQTNNIIPPLGSLPQSFLLSNDDNVQETGIYQSKANTDQQLNLPLRPLKLPEKALSLRRDSPKGVTLTKEEDFMYKQMFRKIVQERDIPIDNLFNIIFAESEHEFNSHCGKLYRQAKAKGRLLVRNPSNNYLQIQLKEMNKKMFFIKGILNFVFPGLIIKKISEQCKQLKKNNIRKFKSFIPPYQVVDSDLKTQKGRQSAYLSKSLLIMNKSNSAPDIQSK